MLELIFIIGVLLEMIIYVVPPLWKHRRVVIGFPLAVTAFATGIIMFYDWQVWGAVLLVVISLFRIINMLRVAENRMHEQYLKRTVRRTGLIFGALQLSVVGILHYRLVSFSDIFPLFVILQLIVAGLVLGVVVWNIKRTKHKPALQSYADKELPTVTVAIPARNETNDLEDCLRSIIANNYPKFEVLVLDDCSHDKTPEIIKTFAHDGVRFIKGAEPNGRWLAKNQAYDRLADEATGELILFCGVDTRFGPETIRALVTTMLSRKKDMISVMPRRLTSDVFSAFIQPMRYWWELAVPRKFLNRPSVLSTCWLIRRNILKRLGGFDAVQHSILPEGYFAREVVKHDGYSFVRADDLLDVQTRKGLQQQRETAIRMRYPQVRRRLEMVLLLVCLEVLFLLAPFLIGASGIWLGFGSIQLIAIVASALLVLAHVIIVQVSNPANVLVAMLNYPIVVCTEMVTGLVSMYKYEFSEVRWKDRNICEPVMHVIPKLPDLP